VPKHDILIVCSIFVWKRICAGLFIYVLSFEIQLSKGNGSDPINWSSHAISLDLDLLSQITAFQRDEV